MARIRIRWRALGKGAALAAIGVLGLQLLPALLKPPEPPPLANDVGLPRIAVERQPVSPAPGLSEARALRRDHRRPRRSKPRKNRQPRPVTRVTPPAASPSPPSAQPQPAPIIDTSPVPAPKPAPAPAPPPTPAPAPTDGSLEFAPH